MKSPLSQPHVYIPEYLRYTVDITNPDHAVKLTHNGLIYRDIVVGPNSRVKEGVKISNRIGVTLLKSRIHGGYEDCIDIVRGEAARIHNVDLTALDNKGTRTFITIKGGAKDVLISNITLVGRTRWFWAISLGDHTIYPHEVTDGVILTNIRYADRPDKTVWVLSLLARSVIANEKHIRVIQVPVFLVRYVWFPFLDHVAHPLARSKVWKWVKGLRWSLRF